MKKINQRAFLLLNFFALTLGFALSVHAKDPLYLDTRHSIPGFIEFENHILVTGIVPTERTPRYEVGKGEVLKAMKDGAEADYIVNAAYAGEYELKIRYSNSSSLISQLEFYEDATLLGSVSLNKTLSSNSFETITTNITLTQTGDFTFKVKFLGGDVALSEVSLNWMAFRRLRSTASPQIITVSPTGGLDSNPGTEDAPLKTVKRAFDRIAEINTSNPTHGPIEIRLNEGYHEITEQIRLTSDHTGTPDGPISLRKVSGPGSAIVGGGRKLPLSALQKVEDAGSLNRLKANARGNVYRAHLADADWVKRFTHRVANSLYEATVSYNGAYLMLARTPNKGLEPLVSESGTSFKLASSFDIAAWRNEFNVNKDIFVSGHLHSDEFEESNFVKSIDPDGRINLETLSFTKTGRNARIINVLYELDMPGEWFYDVATKEFYIWPLASLELNPEIRVGGYFTTILAENLEYWTVRDLIFSDNGGTGNFDGPTVMIGFANCKDLIFGGNTIRNSMARVTARFDGGTRNIITGNDFYDCSSPFVVNGAGTLFPAQNSQTEFTNNQIYRLRNRGYGGGGISGAGTRFANNHIYEVHAGQSYTNLNEGLLELNEWHDCGYELGDWNVAYVGASWSSLGNVVRHNMVYNMIAPYGRRAIGAFRYDDAGAGLTFVGNLLNRVGEYGLALANHGGTVANNVTLQSGTLLLTGNPTGLIGSEVRTAQEISDEWNKHLNEVPIPIPPSKATFIYNAQNLYGNNYWQTPYFAYKYPLIDSAYDVNPFTRTAFELRRNYVANVVTPVSARGDIATTVARAMDGLDGEIPNVISTSDFMDLSIMDLRFKPSFTPQAGFYEIPFHKIGLYKDEFRTVVPHKNTYRAGSVLKWKNNAGRTSDPTTHNLPYPDRAFNRKVVYDCGVHTSPLYPLTTLVTNSTHGTYGWVDTTGVEAYDRSVGNDLNRDVLYSSDTSIFEQVVENGPWYALVTFGDQIARSGINFHAENSPIENDNKNFSTNSNEYINKFVAAYVTDGRFSLKFSGGARSITRIIIQNTPFNAGQPQLLNPNLGEFNKASEIGNPYINGVTSESDGIYTLQGSGKEIGGTSDQFHFASKSLIDCNSNINTKVISLSNTSVSTKVGLMIRDSIDAGSRNVGVFVLPDGQVSMQWRDVKDGTTSSHPLQGGTGFPKWIRIIRDGSNFTGYYSTDSTIWNQIGTTTTVNLNCPAMGGLALTSGDTSKLATAKLSLPIYGLIKVKVLGMELNPDDLKVREGFSGALNTVFNPENSADKSITWLSSNTGVVAVDQKGVFTAMAIGSANIVATTNDGGFKDTCKVTVIAKDDLVIEKPMAYWPFDEFGGSQVHDVIGGLTGEWQDTGNEPDWSNGVSGNAAYLKGGDNDRFLVTGDPLTGTKALTISAWFNSNRLGGYKGLVTTRPNNWGVSAENNHIDARWNGQAIDSKDDLSTGKWYNVILTWDSTGTKNLYLNGKLEKTESSSLTTYTGNNSWMFGDDVCCGGREFDGQLDDVVMFNRVLPLEEIELINDYASMGASIMDMIAILTESIEVAPKEISILGSATDSATATVLPANATDKSVWWSSADESIATVDQSGTITGVGAGVVDIIATTVNGGLTDTVKVTVIEIVPANITITPSSLSIAEKATEQLTAKVLPDNAADKSFTWASTNGVVAHVSPSGLVTALQEGTTYITATTTTGGLIDSCKVDVYYIRVEGITLSDTALAMKSGENAQLSFTITPGNAKNQLVEWKTGNNNVAFVSNDGSILAISKGITDISVTTVDGNFTAICEVNVDNHISGIKDLNTEEIRLYPNPALNEISIYGLDRIDVSRVDIFDAQGSLISYIENMDRSNKLDIDISGLAPGVYFIKMKNIKNQHIIKHFVKK